MGVWWLECEGDVVFVSEVFLELSRFCGIGLV